MSRREFKTEAERLAARRRRTSDSVWRSKLRKQGEDVPTDPKGIAAWWRRRGY